MGVVLVVDDDFDLLAVHTPVRSAESVAAIYSGVSRQLLSEDPRPSDGGWPTRWRPFELRSGHRRRR